MVYKIKLKIDGKSTTFQRTGEPILQEITQATIISAHQMEMYQETGIPSDENIQRNEKDISKFAVMFWRNQFSEQDVISGANLESVEAIKLALDDCMGVKDPENEEETKK